MSAGPPVRQVINAYGSGGFRVSGVAYRGSILILPTLTQAWPAAAVDGSITRDLVVMVKAGPRVEILLIGCGPRMLQLPADLRSAFKELNIGLEAMDTGAACRTYNVLSAEGRRVGAALIPVG